jgi:hypothetical protein
MNCVVSVGSSGFWFCSSATRSFRKSVVDNDEDELELDDDDEDVEESCEDIAALTAEIVMAS